MKLEPPTDPREPGGGIVGPGGPYERHGVIIDTRNAVLLDNVHVALIEPWREGEPQPDAIALELQGRINKTPERATILYLLDLDGAATIIEELIALAHRAGMANDLGKALAAKHDSKNRRRAL